MNKKEIDPNQLDLFKPQSDSVPKKDDKMTNSEWDAANNLAFDMTIGKGTMIKNLSRKEREAQNAEIKKDINRLYAKLGLPPKEGDQAEILLESDKK